MKNKCLAYGLSLVLLTSLFSCGNKMKGKITFELDGGTFPDSFGTTYIEGESGTPILTEIPDPVKSGYYFVGWREKTKDGAYRTINKRTDKDGKSHYFYPYVNDTFYAYFEPLSTIVFDLTLGKDVAKLVAPKVDSASFQDGKLNGYASKKLLSLDYLPTTSIENGHLTFDYWYTKYPLKAVTDENGQKHYSLDTAGEIGEYEFDRSFGTDNMCFPISETNEFVLYAKWTADPTITVHYNLDGVSDSVFQGKNNISSLLISEMLAKTGIDLNAADYTHFYTTDKNKRFTGFYLDSDLKTRFNISSTIGDDNIDLYLGWDDKITVTLDYQDGTCNGKNKEEFKDYYASDVLGKEFFDAHIPTALEKDFVGYRLDGNPFDFEKDHLPSHDVTLSAIYADYPTLSLHYDYPDGYSGTKRSDSVTKVKGGSDISALLTAFETSMNDNSLVVSRFYKMDGTDKVDLTSKQMPLINEDIYMEINYRPVVDFKVYMNTASSYELQSDITFDKMYLDNGQIVTLDSLSDKTASVEKLGSTYLFDGFYTDDTFKEKVMFPLYMISSHTERKSRMLYQKMTKAISVTFVEKTTGNAVGIAKVIPESKISDSKEAVALLGEYSKLIIMDGTEEKEVSFFPASEATIYVYR